MSEQLADDNVARAWLRGEIDTDPAAYRRARYAQMLSGEKTWICRGNDTGEQEVYNYYDKATKLGYVQTEADGTAQGFSIAPGGTAEFLAEFPDLDAAVNAVPQLLRPNPYI